MDTVVKQYIASLQEADSFTTDESITTLLDISLLTRHYSTVPGVGKNYASLFMTVWQSLNLVDINDQVRDR